MLKNKIAKLSDLAVADYLDAGTPLNSSIEKIAKDEGLGGQHIERLVEAANTKLFLKLFPEKHSFEVASADKIKESVGCGKEASTKEEGPFQAGDMPFLANAYENCTNYKVLDMGKSSSKSEEAINLPDVAVKGKQAAVEDYPADNKVKSTHAVMVLRGQVKRAIEELKKSAGIRRDEIAGSIERLVDITKHAVLKGTSFAELETYTLGIISDDNIKAAQAVVDRVYDRIKDMQFVGKRASERGTPDRALIGEENVYNELVNNIIKVAVEELPIIDNGIDVLGKQLEAIEKQFESN